MIKTTLYRFLAPFPSSKLREAKSTSLQIDKNYPDLLHQLTKVLRVQPGDRIVFTAPNTVDLETDQFFFSVQKSGKHEVTMKMDSQSILRDPFPERLGLVLALPNKPAKLAEILQHCTELGVTDFTLLPTDHSHFKHALHADRLQKIIDEAVEQSERARIPIITTKDSLEDYLKNKSRTCLVAMERSESAPNLLEIDIHESIDLLIGPEGGFSEREKELIQKIGLPQYSLGNQILRNQTAAILSCGVVSLKYQRLASIS